MSLEHWLPIAVGVFLVSMMLYGHCLLYTSNEKYMASMFGFPHFVLAQKQPTGNGRFGYWYTDIRLDNLS